MDNKINKTAYNFFLCLLFIIKKRIFSVEEVLVFLEQEHQVFIFYETVLKYIRTMKNLGFIFKKLDNATYQLISVPFEIVESNFDYDILLRSILFSKRHHSKETKSEKCLLLEKLKLFLPEDVKEKINSVLLQENQLLIGDLKQYCQDGQRLKIAYLVNEKQEITNIIEPYEVITISNGIYLRGFNLDEKNNILLNIYDVKNVIQTPVKNKYSKIKQVAVVRFIGKFAKSYSLKENEEIIKKEPGNLLVRSFYDDKELFFKNVLRYMQNCEIVEPQRLRCEFKKYLQDLYQIYDCRN